MDILGTIELEENMMSDTGIKHKLKVFISSRCGGKYTIARKALQKLLETTGLVEVYVFESEPASSEDTRSAYLNYVDESNLIIILADNKDDITEPVESEIKRAKSMNLKMLYVFCDEKKKKPLRLQEDIKENASQKYKIIHEFADFVEVAYDSVMQDIINVYKNKNKPFISSVSEDDKSTKSMASKVMPVINGLSPLKEKEFKHVSSILTKGLVYSDSLNNNSKETVLEQLLSTHIQMVIHKKPFDEEVIDKICDEVIKIQCNEIQELLKMRFNIQKLYYKNMFDKCIIELQKAFEIALTDDNIPIWIANDIAIDIRHLYYKTDELNSKITFDNPGQKRIDNSLEPVFYPYLDRQVYNMYEEVSKHYYKQLTVSPYSTNYGGIEPMFNYLSNAFCVAEIFGSIVQTEITRDRLIRVYSMLCTLYDDHDLLVEYIRLLVVNRNTKELDTIIRANNQTVELMNQNDIQIILDSIDMIFDDTHKTMSKYLIASRLGYYMSSESYDSLCDELLDYAAKWVNDNKRIYNLNKYIFDFLKECKNRAPIERIISFILLCFNKDNEALYDECFKLMSKMDFSDATQNDQNDIKQVLIRLLASKAKFHSYNEAIIRFCKSSTIEFDDLEAELSRVDAKLYNSDFILELTGERNGDFSSFILEQLESIKAQNKTIVKTGAYFDCGSNGFDIINRIITHYNPDLSEELVESIIDTIIETLGKEGQTVKTKMSALSLLQRLYCKKPRYKRWTNIVKNMRDNASAFSSGVRIDFLEKNNNTNLAFQYDLFLIIFRKDRQESLINSLFSIGPSDSYNVIQTLRLISNFLIDVNGTFENETVLLSMLHFCIFMLGHKERDIKHFVTECLIGLTGYEITTGIAVLQISKILNSGTVDEKMTVLKQIDRIKTDDHSLRKQIILKCKSDNHYLVRHLANSIEV